MLGYLSLDIVCSSKLTVFLELRSQKAVPFSEYPSIFSLQREAIVYMSATTVLSSITALGFGSRTSSEESSGGAG